MNLTLFESQTLDLPRCPHCNVATPLLSSVHKFTSQNSAGTRGYKWKVFVCSKCGGPTFGGCGHNELYIQLIFPAAEKIDEALPPKALAFLQQAVESIHAPSGAIMLCASSVDAMLKDKGFKTGNLYSRIEAAAEKHLITSEMAKWAHEVRLDANDERHADDEAKLPTETDAKKCIDFTKALAEFLFVLPSRVERGLAKPQPKTKKT